MLSELMLAYSEPSQTYGELYIIC